MARLIIKSPYFKGGGSSGKSAAGYLRYIATRPRAERVGRHGLFGDADTVDLEKAMTELSEYPGSIWTHIISLKREDAERLGYDNAKAWRNLLRTHRNEIAAAMNISPADFRWYAAFHDEGHHPHVHMIAWSAKPGQAYLNQEGIRKIKSELTRDIFQGELLHLYEQKSSSRDELVRQGRKALLELTKRMRSEFCDSPVLESKMLELAEALETVKGKKVYGYLKSKSRLRWMPSWMSWRSSRGWRSAMNCGGGSSVRWKISIPNKRGCVHHSLK